MKVCNPYCGPCDKAHPILEDLIRHNQNVKLKIIYISRNNEFDKGRFIVKHLAALATNHCPEEMQHILDDWYANPSINKNYDTFAIKYPVDEKILDNQSLKIAEMSEWCSLGQITHTPTIFIDGYRLPENYEMTELKFIL